MTLFEEFLLRLKMDKALAAAAECQVRVDAGLAKIAAYEAEAAALLKQAEAHLAGNSIIDNQFRGDSTLNTKFLPGSVIPDATLGARQVKVIANSGLPDRVGRRAGRVWLQARQLQAQPNRAGQP